MEMRHLCMTANGLHVSHKCMIFPGCIHGWWKCLFLELPFGKWPGCWCYSSCTDGHNDWWREIDLLQLALACFDGGVTSHVLCSTLAFIINIIAAGRCFWLCVSKFDAPACSITFAMQITVKLFVSKQGLGIITQFQSIYWEHKTHYCCLTSSNVTGSHLRVTRSLDQSLQISPISLILIEAQNPCYLSPQKQFSYLYKKQL